MDGFSAIAKVMTEFYHQLIGEQQTNRTHISHEIIQVGHTLTIEQRFMLCTAVTTKEIREVIF